jgi:DNA-binding FadR family transcriptional regulator
MSISAVSSNVTAYQTNAQNSFRERRADFQQLAQALQSGNMTGAQQAFAALQQAGSSSGAQGQSSPPSGQSNPLANDFSTLGQALQAGDLSSAQKAFATLQQDMQGIRQAHHHHHHGGVQNAAASAVSGLSATGGVATSGDNDSSPGLKVNTTA